MIEKMRLLYLLRANKMSPMKLSTASKKCSLRVNTRKSLQRKKAEQPGLRRAGHTTTAAKGTITPVSVVLLPALAAVTSPSTFAARFTSAKVSVRRLMMANSLPMS